MLVSLAQKEKSGGARTSWDVIGPRLLVAEYNTNFYSAFFSTGSMTAKSTDLCSFQRAWRDLIAVRRLGPDSEHWAVWS
nr:hypothetical protein CFP56_74670 [Quercus suber]